MGTCSWFLESFLLEMKLEVHEQKDGNPPYFSLRKSDNSCLAISCWVNFPYVFFGGLLSSWPSKTTLRSAKLRDDLDISSRWRLRLSTKARYYFIKTSDVWFLLRFWHPNTEILNDSGYVRICQAIHNFVVQKLLSDLQKNRQGIYTLCKSLDLIFEKKRKILCFFSSICCEVLSSSHPFRNQRTNGPIVSAFLGKVLKVKDTLTKARENRKKWHPVPYLPKHPIKGNDQNFGWLAYTRGL